MDNQSLNTAAKYIKEANVLIFTSGAGMGVDSGIGTFRGKNVRNWEPLTKLGLSYQEMCTPIWFEDNENPNLAFGFWQACYDDYVNNKPHEGYYLLQKWAKDSNKPYFSYTSNVDGHWSESGIPEDQLVEIHGNSRYQQCRDNCSKDIWATELDCNIDPSTKYALDPLPKCPNCQESFIRPNVCMFEDYGCNFQRIKLQKHNWYSWAHRKSQKITVIEIGAGTTITTIRRLSKSIIDQHPTNRLVRINLENDDLNDVNPNQGISIKGGALDALKKIDDIINEL